MKSLKQLRTLTKRWLELFSTNPAEKEYYVDKLVDTTEHFACHFVIWLEDNKREDLNLEELWKIFIRENGR